MLRSDLIFTYKLFFIACWSIRNFNGRRKAWKVRLFCQLVLQHFLNCYGEMLIFKCYWSIWDNGPEIGLE